ncbi:MAG TPA: RHS repeat-associated core domain-containing protein [Oleiagrimonas sp.]|nr:RHS repeat-associated core domain-containing protein [Oleiagrimonas sp.]
MNMKCKRKSQIIAARLPHRVKSAIALLIFVLVAGSAMPAWSETVTYYVTNAQGTVVATIDSKGNVTYTAAYRPYGKQVKGTPQSGPGYTGHVNDPDTGLVYMQQRYYDPEIKRFPSPDPIGPTPGNIYNFNRYAYANNNPVRYTDPDGRKIHLSGNDENQQDLINQMERYTGLRITEGDGGMLQYTVPDEKGWVIHIGGCTSCHEVN